jgi:hypothetical protein
VLVFVIVTVLQPRFADAGNLQVIGLDLADYGILTIGGGESRSRRVTAPSGERWRITWNRRPFRMIRRLCFYRLTARP